jgi:hypothetical protein
LLCCGKQHNRGQHCDESADQLREDESWDVINDNSRKRRREASRKSNSGIGKRG